MAEYKKTVQGSVIKNMYDLLDVYASNFKFSCNSLIHNQDLLFECMFKVQVFFPGNTQLTLIGKLLRNREPTNMSMNQYYDKALLKALFGYDTSQYTVHYNETRELAPNFGLFTPVIFEKTDDVLNILTLTGLAFDVESQPDYQYLMTKTPDEREEFVRLHYSRFVEMIVWCLTKNGFKRIIISQIGTSVFARLYHDNKGSQSSRMIELWNEVVIEKLKRTDIPFYTLGLSSSDNMIGFPTSQKDLHEKIDKIEPSPDKKKFLRETLFVIPGDPHSIPGNGNNSDNSCNGFVGRHTSIAICGSPLINPFFTEDKFFEV